MTLVNLRETVGRLAHFRFIFVILINLIPLCGVALLGWDAGQILFFYWFENVIIGLITLPKVFAARNYVRDESSPNKNYAVGMGCFFMIHYGGFCLVHGIFTLILAARFITDDPAMEGVVEPPFNATFLWGLACLLSLHVLALVRDWWLPRAWRIASPTLEMFRPYGRIFVLHITVMGGAWAMHEYSAPEWTILILCLGKAVLELVTTWIVGTGNADAVKAASVR